MPPTPREIVLVVNALQDVVEDTVIQLAFEVHANLVETTPVDTGWARANWVHRIGNDNNRVIQAEGNVQAADAAAIAARAELFSYNLAQGRVFVSNHVPYIEELNMGRSPQAPAGFVQNAIDKAVREVL